ncbi:MULTISPECIES: hypothetical protein [Priestia]|uniref:DUF4352 domain-containing protein n=1 Tax=Priestia aryabhattai TaxID=412384 RepID=A0ABD5KUH2_PRIAR|nr:MULTISPECIES: hypothetical protein [Priestia]MBK0292432.1 hypothetical protein [Bacillus sp. S34]UPK47761.1 hypothetical protein MT476_13790 [Bacillus sp. H8-1]AWD67328.1 hypothetical protein C2I28_20535 [Priestia megaterium]MDC7764373.1 hypothetical protein [Priestia aryabhattai]MED3820040.1 hypothetical protein [Priestia aryabhattai]
MRKSLLLFSFALMVFAFSTTIKANALTFDQLPTTQKSGQWTVEIDKVKDSHPEDMKPKKGVYQTYGLTIQNTKNDATDVKVELFRDEENTTTKYGIVNTERETLSKNAEYPFQFANFPLSEKAKELEVVITWKEKGSDRNYQERFTFSQD